MNDRTKEQKLREMLRKLIDACNFRDAVMASDHTEKLDYAVENYAMCVRMAQNILSEGPP